MSAKSVVKHVLTTEGVETDEITIYFVTSPEICRLHAVFFRDPSPTDCISFPIDGAHSTHDGYHVLGEVFICPHTAIKYLTTQTEEVTSDPYQETTLYLVHGLLHLIGYDDIEDKDCLKMRAAEKKHMEGLLSQNLLLKSSSSNTGH